MTEGERWAREALARLRDEGLGPAASVRFLVASQRRANERRAQRPQLAAQARAWSACGALAWLIAAGASAGPCRRRLGSGLAWWGVTALMLDWHLGMVETEAGAPRPLGPADACTLARCWLVPLACDHAGPLVLAAGFASEGLDGALARATAPTRAGRDLEGAVDAAFAAAALRGAVRHGNLSRRAAALEATRLAAGFGVACAAYFGRARAPNRTLARAARASTPVRAAGLLAAGLGRPRTADILVSAGALAGIASVVAAFAQRRTA